MSKARNMCCLFLSFIILITSVFANSLLSLKAGAVTYAYIDATNVNIREDATTSSRSLGKVSNVTVTVNGEKAGADGYTWYNITYNGITGYIRGDFVKIIQPETDKSFEEQLNAFPESYRPYLTELHKIYPNWRFYADNINISFENAAEKQILRKVTDYKSESWFSMDKGSFDWNSGKWVTTEKGRWHYISREVIKYYMDPRNFLNSTYIYSYMKQNYDPATQTEEGLAQVVKGTFLERGYSDPNDTAYGGSYIKVIMAAAQHSGVNPYVLAGTIIQEQGVNGTSGIIAGPYYNFFNIRANGENPIQNGIAYAKSQGWNTRSKAIIGGAAFCGNDYVKAGQNTYFYMNYNVKGNASHQYATAAHNAASSASFVSKTYKNLGSAALDFLIPVYRDMPQSRAEQPVRNGSKNNYYFNLIAVEGLTPSFDRFTYSYNLEISADTIIRLSVPEGASYSGAKVFDLSPGENTVILPVTSQTGYTRNYVVSVKANAACKLYADNGGGVIINPGTDDPGNTVRTGDTNGDGKITLIDLANIQRHLLGLISLTGNGFIGGDTNKDGKITLIDLANVQRHLLGLIVLS